DSPRSTVTCDVLVVGAGPAGIAAALELHRSGLDVLVIDKATFPRDKCCGDGLTTGALRVLESLGFDPALVPSWTPTSDVWLRSPSGREMSMPLPIGKGTFAAIAPRLEFDDALVRTAIDRGVRVAQGVAFTQITSMNDDGVVVSVDGLGDVRCGYVIAADGMWSPVRKSLGLSQPGYLGEWHAFRQYASNVTGPAKDRLIVWFDSDLLPGYAWSFPLRDGRVNIGFGILRGGRHSVQDMNTLWPDILSRPHVREALGENATLEGRHTAWPIPARVTSATLAHERVLFVGDAACVTDTLTGEGIGQALLSGVLAGQAIATSRAHGARSVSRSYKRAIRRNFFADHRMSVTLGAILKSELGARGALRLANTNDWTRRNFVRWMFEDEPRAAIFTPSRWHRGFLKRPGVSLGSSK
ncbi:MAG: NAD(P)/FAD-dependent oxidoreductase, partial [Ilumatobacteraceae bacterium]